jgi:hypothetical protein
MSHDDFETQVRLALGDHAGDAPRVDLADAALARARGIRRRRAVVSAGALVATAAVAVPVGAHLASDNDARDHTASPHATDQNVTPHPATQPSNATLPAPTTHVAIAGLGSGPPPHVPYIDGSTFVDAAGGEHAAEATNGLTVTDAAGVDGGVLIWQENTSKNLTTYSAEGGSTDLPAADSVTRPAIDHGDTPAAVFAVHNTHAAGAPAQGDTIVYARALSGGTSTVETGLDIRQVMGSYNGEVIFNAVDGGEHGVVGLVTVPGGDTSVQTPWPNLTSVTAVSPDETQLAGILASGYQSGQRHCAAMIDAADATTMWTRCPWNPLEFSPDGSRVLARDWRSEGLGPNRLAVLDAQTGDVVQEYTTSGVFGRATFDGAADTVLMVVAVEDQASIVRCSVGGDCELATPPAIVAPGDPDAVLRPYQLTAN